MLSTDEMNELIAKQCDAIKEMLLEKNTSYGSAVSDPVSIFSKLDPVQQVRVRIDDKLKRLRDGHEFSKEDTKIDLIGYMIIERILLGIFD